MSTQQIPAALAVAAQGFGRYLEAERGRSAHTVRAYLSDVGSLLEHAASEGVEDLAGLELGTLRRWLGSQSEAGMSRATLARRFTELVGEPPMQFLTGWRLALAADLLRDPDTTLAAVARRVGYSTPFALSTAFKRARGVSP